jgi:hypothetical protein
MSKKWSEIFVKFLYPDAVVSIVINIFILHIYTHNILKYSFNEVKACQCENEETKNNRIGVGTTIERDNRRTSKKFLLSYSFNKKRVSRYSVSETRASVKVRSPDQKRKVELLQKTTTTKL